MTNGFIVCLITFCFISILCYFRNPIGEFLNLNPMPETNKLIEAQNEFYSLLDLKNKELEVREIQLNMLRNDYNKLKENYETCIKSINNDIVSTCEVVKPEIIIQQPDYLIWGFGVIVAIILCGIGYYFLSNQDNLLEKFSFFKQNEQPILIENIDRSSSLVSRNNIPEIDMPEITSPIITDHIANRAVNPLIMPEEMLIDNVFDQFVSRLIDDSLVLGVTLNTDPHVFDMILNNNQMLQQLLIMNS